MSLWANVGEELFSVEENGKEFSFWRYSDEADGVVFGCYDYFEVEIDMIDFDLKFSNAVARFEDFVLDISSDEPHGVINEISRYAQKHRETIVKKYNSSSQRRNNQ